MVSKKVLIVIPIVVIIFAAGFWMILSGVKPPVDVYAKTTPSSNTEPESLLPTSVAGFDCTNIETILYSVAVEAVGTYEGNVRIEITRANYASHASDYVDYLYEAIMDGKRSKVSASNEHWFTCEQSNVCTFVWRKGIWVFCVSAPNETIRNEVIEELSF
jgi:hypothetical protein